MNFSIKQFEYHDGEVMVRCACGKLENILEGETCSDCMKRKWAEWEAQEAGGKKCLTCDNVVKKADKQYCRSCGLRHAWEEKWEKSV